MSTLVALGSREQSLDPALLNEKQEKLFSLLEDMDRVIVAYSGGADSAYLAWAANKVLGSNAVAITADSASIPESHKRDAEAFAQHFAIRHEYIDTYDFDNPDYAKTAPAPSSHSQTTGTPH